MFENIWICELFLRLADLAKIKKEKLQLDVMILFLELQLQYLKLRKKLTVILYKR